MRGAVSTNILHFSRELSYSCPDRLAAADASFVPGSCQASEDCLMVLTSCGFCPPSITPAPASRCGLFCGSLLGT